VLLQVDRYARGAVGVRLPEHLDDVGSWRVDLDLGDSVHDHVGEDVQDGVQDLVPFDGNWLDLHVGNKACDIKGGLYYLWVEYVRLESLGNAALDQELAAIKGGVDMGHLAGMC